MVILSFYPVFSIVTLQLPVTFSIVCEHFLQYGEGSGAEQHMDNFYIISPFSFSALLERTRK
jgi:hypothetical protein